MAIGRTPTRRARGADRSAGFAQLAERQRRKGNLERAVEICQKGLAEFPAHLSGRVTLGWALLDLERYDEARVELENVLRRAPDNLLAIRGLAELHDRAESAMHLDMDAPGNWQSDAVPEAFEQPPTDVEGTLGKEPSDDEGELKDLATLVEAAVEAEAASASTTIEPEVETASAAEDPEPALEEPVVENAFETNADAVREDLEARDAALAVEDNVEADDGDRVGSTERVFDASDLVAAAEAVDAAASSQPSPSVLEPAEDDADSEADEVAAAVDLVDPLETIEESAGPDAAQADNPIHPAEALPEPVGDADILAAPATDDGAEDASQVLALGNDTPEISADASLTETAEESAEAALDAASALSDAIAAQESADPDRIDFSEPPAGEASDAADADAVEAPDLSDAFAALQDDSGDQPGVEALDLASEDADEPSASVDDGADLADAVAAFSDAAAQATDSSDIAFTSEDATTAADSSLPVASDSPLDDNSDLMAGHADASDLASEIAAFSVVQDDIAPETAEPVSLVSGATHLAGADDVAGSAHDDVQADLAALDSRSTDDALVTIASMTTHSRQELVEADDPADEVAFADLDSPLLGGAEARDLESAAAALAADTEDMDEAAAEVDLGSVHDVVDSEAPSFAHFEQGLPDADEPTEEAGMVGATDLADHVANGANDLEIELAAFSSVGDDDAADGRDSLSPSLDAAMPDTSSDWTPPDAHESGSAGDDDHAGLDGAFELSEELANAAGGQQAFNAMATSARRPAEPGTPRFRLEALLRKVQARRMRQTVASHA